MRPDEQPWYFGTGGSGRTFNWSEFFGNPEPTYPTGGEQEYWGSFPLIEIIVRGKRMKVPVTQNDLEALLSQAHRYEEQIAAERRARQYEEQKRQQEQYRRQQEAFDNLRDAFSSFGGSANFSRAGTSSKPRAVGPFQRLCEIAGVEPLDAGDMDKKKLLRRAQRKAHPDSGGSHELWLEVESLQRRLGY